MRKWPGPGAPSLSTSISLLALAIAVTGTAVAATGTHMNIVDSLVGTYIARVDNTGALKTSVSGYVGPNTPRVPLSLAAYLLAGTATVSGVNSSIVGLSRVGVSEYADSSFRTNIHVQLLVYYNTGKTCDASAGAQILGSYEVPAGTTVIDSLPSPITLKPLAAGQTWCLKANVTVVGSPVTYYLPLVFINGFVVAGSYASVSPIAAARSATAGGLPPLSGG
jgi:hypothetical protein